MIDNEAPIEVPATVSILDEDMSSVDTSIPLIKEGIYTLELTKVEEVDTTDKLGKNLKCKFTLIADAESTDGQIVNKGFPVFHQTLITPKGGMTLDMVKRNLALILQPMGLKTLRDLLACEGQGRTVLAKVGIERATKNKETGKEYPAKNVIKAFLKPQV